TPLPRSPPALRARYRDRWPVEQLPLVAKQRRCTPVRPCAPDLPATAGARPAGRSDPRLCRSEGAGHPDWLLGSAPPPTGRAAAPRPAGLSLSGRLPAASATPSTTRRHGTSADRVLGAAPPAASSHGRCGITLPVAGLAKTRVINSSFR